MKKVILGLLLSLLATCAFATNAPSVVSTSTDAALTQLTISGSGFSPTNTAPLVNLGSANLSIVSFTDAQIVAALPSNEAAGSYSLTVTETGGGSKTTTFGVTIGAVGPQGPIGPQGPAGANGVPGATRPQGPTGPQGAQGVAGASAFAGTWQSGASYGVGQIVFWSPSGPPGVYINASGQNSVSPDLDFINWVKLSSTGGVTAATPGLGCFNLSLGGSIPSIFISSDINTRVVIPVTSNACAGAYTVFSLSSESTVPSSLGSNVVYGLVDETQTLGGDVGGDLNCQVFPGSNTCDYHSDPATNTLIVNQGDTVYLMIRVTSPAATINFIQNYITWTVQ